MGLQPEDSTASFPGTLRRVVPGLALASGLLGAAWLGADAAGAALYRQLKPWLERQAGRAMGHPLELGPYQGLRPWGLSAGPSRFQPGPDNPSTITVSGVSVGFDPLRSLVQRAWVLPLQLREARVQLRRNSRGSYWSLGAMAPGREPPRLSLRLHLQGPAEVTLASASGAPLRFGLEGESEIQLRRHQISLNGAARLAQGGQLRFMAAGNWQNRSWRAWLMPQQLPLAPLVPLLPGGLQRQLSSRLDGRVHGRILLQQPGRLASARAAAAPRCQGGLAIDGAQWRWGVLPAPLRADRLDLGCEAQRLLLRRSTLRMGAWQGQSQGSFALAGAQAGRLQLRLEARNRAAGHRFRADLSGPWRHPDLRLSGSLQGPKLRGQAPRRFDLLGLVALESRRGLRLDLRQLSLRSGASQLRAKGQLWPRLAVASDPFPLGADLLTLHPALRQFLGPSAQVNAELQLSGSLPQPQLALALRQPNNPLLGSTRARLRWAAGLLTLESLRSPELTAQGELPLGFKRGRGLQIGALRLQLDLRRYPLARLAPLIGSTLQGQFDAWGSISGSLQDLRPALQLVVQAPGAGPVLLNETWSGALTARSAGGGDLRLVPQAPAAPGTLEALLDRRWLPRAVQLSRGGGSLRFSGSPSRYVWTSSAFPLNGLQLAMGPRSTRQPLQGNLSGRGVLDLQPLWMRGTVQVDQPALLGVRGRRLVASGEYRDRRFTVNGALDADQDSRVGLQLKGERGGAIWSRFEGRRLASPLLRQFLAAWPLWRGDPQPPPGAARDLGTLMIDTLGGSLSDQLVALETARARLAAAMAVRNAPGRRLDLADLEGLVDADLTLQGPRADRLVLNLAARGHLWLQREDRDLALGAEPFTARLQGPLRQGGGSFSLEHLPLSLLALLSPVPASLRGGLMAQGRYQLGGARPELEASLGLQQAELQGRPLSLERGLVRLEPQAIAVDWSLRSGGAANSLDLRGQVPLQPDATGLELRLSSRGDGLHFLSALGGEAVKWQQGDADLQLLVRGSLSDPIANGFLRFRKGVLRVAGQTMRDLEATVLFDFQELELQQLTARVGPSGSLSGSGQLALVQERTAAPRLLKLQLKQAPLAVPRLRAQVDGTVLVSGALVRPVLSGELQLSRGSLNVQPGQLATETEARKPVSVRELLEAKWDFRQPLLVMGADLESNTSRDLRETVPNLPLISLNGLRLRLGPDLAVTVPNVLNFNTGGVLTLSGRLDPSIQARGVVRLLNGRLGLFTTTFSLDPKAPNVAIFTPSLGLIPYIDIALRTRVSDTLGTTDASRSNIYDWSVAEPTSAIDQLRLVKVMLTATGPADRLAENIRLSSTPPLPEDRLLALVGGNSLVGLIGGNAGAALATVLGQSLLSPLVGGLSEAFGQRLTFALYPTYFTPAEAVAVENRSRRLPSQLVLGSEIGLDLTERFNFSVLAAPNRSDIPPQVTVRYQASDLLGVQTSVDTEGRWQSQLQIFLRF